MMKIINKLKGSDKLLHSKIWEYAICRHFLGSYVIPIRRKILTYSYYCVGRDRAKQGAV